MKPDAIPSGDAGPVLEAAAGPLPAAEPVAASEPGFRWPSWRDALLGLWLAGSVLVLGLLLRRVLRFQAAVRQAAPAPASVVAAVGTMAGRLGMRAPRIRLLPGLGSPAVWSYSRPVLLWPASAAREPLPCSPAVIAHELAHLRRKDHRVSWLELAGQVVFWWNPMLWLLRRQLGHYAELACDAWALWAVPGDPRSYAESLLSALHRSLTPPCAAPGLHAIATDRSSLERRLSMIMRHRLSPRIPPLAALAAVALMLPVLPNLTRGASEPLLAPAELADPRIDPALDPIVRAEIQRVRGERYHKSGHFGLASTALLEAAAADPQDGQLQARLGYSLVRSGRLDEAYRAFQRQIELGHLVSTATFNLGCVRALQGQSRQALEHLEAAMRAGFHDTEMLMDQDLASLRELPELQRLAMRMLAFEKLLQDTNAEQHHDNSSEAVDGLRKILETAPDWGWAHQRLGEVMLDLDRTEEARASFSRMLELRYEPASAHLHLARLEARAGNREPALVHLETMASLSAWKGDHKHKHKVKNKNKNKDKHKEEHGKDEEDEHEHEGGLLEEEEDFDLLKGEPRFKKLVQRAEAWERFEDALKEAEPDDDVKAVRKALEAYLDATAGQQSERGRAYEAFGHALLELRKVQEALEAFQEQLRTRYEIWHALRHMADAYAQLGQIDQAFRCLDAAIGLGLEHKDSLRKDEDGLLQPLRADPRFQKLLNAADDASTLQGFGAVDWKHLESIAKQILVKEPGRGQAQLYLGWAKLRLGDYDGAIAAFHEQEKRDHRIHIARYNLGCVYAYKGDRDEAFRWLDKAVDSGMDQLGQFETDPDLDSLRGDPRFAKLLQKVRDRD